MTHTNERVRGILRGVEIDQADAIANVAEHAAARLRTEGKAAAYLASAGQMADELAEDMVDLERLLDRQPTHREERYVERCVDAYMRAA